MLRDQTVKVRHDAWFHGEAIARIRPVAYDKAEIERVMDFCHKEGLFEVWAYCFGLLQGLGDK